MQLKELLFPVNLENLTKEEKSEVNGIVYKEEIKGERIANGLRYILLIFLFLISSQYWSISGVSLFNVVNTIGIGIAFIYSVVLSILFKKGFYNRAIKYVSLTLEILLVILVTWGYTKVWGYIVFFRSSSFFILFFLVAFAGIRYSPVLCLYAGLLSASLYVGILAYAVMNNYVNVTKDFNNIFSSSSISITEQITKVAFLVGASFVSAYIAQIFRSIIKRTAIAGIERQRAERQNVDILEQKVKERTMELEKSNYELKKAYEELQQTEDHLIKSEKMVAIGQLIFSVAHELNNPINFIYANSQHLKMYLENLKKAINLYEEKFKKIDENSIKEVRSNLDLDFILSDVDVLVKSFHDGAGRVKDIVSNLKTFSKLDERELTKINVNESLENTINLLYFKYKHKVTVHRDYGKISDIECYAGQVNQVFMNLLVNAFQAVEQKNSRQGDVWIKTWGDNENIVVSVKDNGIGIKNEDLGNIFTPFFTTKKGSGGTGLGLHISKDIIERHSGKISVENLPNETIFTVELPLKFKKGEVD